MSKRRGNGEGSICKRKDGLWQCQVTIGFDDTVNRKERLIMAKQERKSETS